MSDERRLDESDWEEQDLLSHEEAAERLRSEVFQARARLVGPEVDERVCDAEKTRLTLMEKRLIDLAERVRVSAAHQE